MLARVKCALTVRLLHRRRLVLTQFLITSSGVCGKVCVSFVASAGQKSDDMQLRTTFRKAAEPIWRHQGLSKFPVYNQHI